MRWDLLIFFFAKKTKVKQKLLFISCSCSQVQTGEVNGLGLNKHTNGHLPQVRNTRYRGWVSVNSVTFSFHLQTSPHFLSYRLRLKSQMWSVWGPGETPSIPPRGITWSVNACRSASPTPRLSAVSSPSPARQPTSSLLSSLTRRYTLTHTHKNNWRLESIWNTL